MRTWILESPWRAPTVVGLGATLGMWAAIAWVQIFHPNLAFDGFKVRSGSADSAWQTIRLAELHSVGPQALWWEHIYPPLYDAFRFILMQPETISTGVPDPIAVDLRLYVVHSLLFGISASVVYLWVRDITRSGWAAAAGSTLWCIVPASFAYFIELNQTGLAICSMAIALYLLFRFCKTRLHIYASGFLIALLVASLTRNVVQIHVLFILLIAVIAFWWMTVGRRSWMLVVNLLLVGLIAAWPIRAFALYATFDVSTHTGYNRAGALWINPQSVPEMVPIDVKQQYRSYASSRDQLNDPSALAQLTPTEIQELRSRFLVEENQWQRVQEEYPGVDIAEADVYPDRLLQNATRLSSNFNTQETLRANYRLGKVANDYLLRQPIDAIVSASQSLSITVPTMFRSIYTQWGNAFNTTFPGVNILDWIFSGWRFGLLIATSAAIIIRHLGIKGTATMMRRYAWFAVFWVLTLIPVLLSNRYWPPDIPKPTHSEADRLRALVDIPVYVMITVAGLLVVNRLRRAYRTPPWLTSMQRREKATTIP